MIYRSDLQLSPQIQVKSSVYARKPTNNAIPTKQRKSRRVRFASNESLVQERRIPEHFWDWQFNDKVQTFAWQEILLQSSQQNSRNVLSTKAFRRKTKMDRAATKIQTLLRRSFCRIQFIQHLFSHKATIIQAIARGYIWRRNKEINLLQFRLSKIENQRAKELRRVQIEKKQTMENFYEECKNEKKILEKRKNSTMEAMNAAREEKKQLKEEFSATKLAIKTLKKCNKTLEDSTKTIRIDSGKIRRSIKQMEQKQQDLLSKQKDVRMEIAMLYFHGKVVPIQAIVRGFLCRKSKQLIFLRRKVERMERQKLIMLQRKLERIESQKQKEMQDIEKKKQLKLRKFIALNEKRNQLRLKQIRRAKQAKLSCLRFKRDITSLTVENEQLRKKMESYITDIKQIMKANGKLEESFAKLDSQRGMLEDKVRHTLQHNIKLVDVSDKFIDAMGGLHRRMLRANKRLSSQQRKKAILEESINQICFFVEDNCEDTNLVEYVLNMSLGSEDSESSWLQLSAGDLEEDNLDFAESRYARSASCRF